MKRISALIFIIIGISAVSAATFPHCFKSDAFSKNFKQELNGRKLEDLFEESTAILGAGSFGQVKAIPWVDKTGKTSIVAVKLAAKQFRVITDQLSLEVDLMTKFKDSKYVTRSLGCLEGLGKFPQNVDKVGSYENETDDVPAIFMVTDKLYGDYSAKGIGLAFLNLPLVDRLKAYKTFAAGLKEIHDKNYLHSDIKPENIMATDSTLKTVKVIDLGLAVPLEAKIFGGTLPYMPFEYHKGNKKAHPSFDIYSFGLSVGQIELGKDFNFDKTKGKPAIEFAPILTSDVMDKLSVKANLKLPADKDNLVELVRDCLKEDPEQRPTTTQIIQRLDIIINELQPNAGLLTERLVSKDLGVKDESAQSERQKVGILSQNSKKEKEHSSFSGYYLLHGVVILVGLAFPAVIYFWSKQKNN